MSPSNADKWVWRVFAACFVASLFTGCASTFEGGAYSGQLLFDKPMTYGAPISCRSGVYTVEFVFTTAEEARKECGGRAMACFRGGVIPKIVAAHPKSWNDSVSLATIGHEACHLAGARHE